MILTQKQEIKNHINCNRDIWLCVFKYSVEFQKRRLFSLQPVCLDSNTQQSPPEFDWTVSDIPYYWCCLSWLLYILSHCPFPGSCLIQFILQQLNLKTEPLQDRWGVSRARNGRHTLTWTTCREETTEQSWWSGRVTICQQCQAAAELTGQRDSEQHQQRESSSSWCWRCDLSWSTERARAVSRTDVHHTLKICIRLSGRLAQTGSNRLQQPIQQLVLL